jgi:hemoglobin-like flavoprotein
MAPPGRPGLAAGRLHADITDADLVHESLESLAHLEGEVVEHFYALFFERHPEVRPLFGEHSVNEREEMVRETFTSVLAHVEGQPWLGENLVAMGRSHAEYGVEGRSYADFVAAMLDTLDHVAPPGWCPSTRAAWRRALERITGVMRRAGDAHGGS